jgi:hypothetical protein
MGSDGVRRIVRITERDDTQLAPRVNFKHSK